MFKAVGDATVHSAGYVVGSPLLKAVETLGKLNNCLMRLSNCSSSLHLRLFEENNKRDAHNSSLNIYSA